VIHPVQKLLGLHVLARHLDSFFFREEMRGGKQTGRQSVGPQDGLGENGRRPLSFGSGHMNPVQAHVGIPDSFQESLYAAEIEKVLGVFDPPFHPLVVGKGIQIVFCSLIGCKPLLRAGAFKGRGIDRR